ncbi:ALMS1 protein, partial [Illadopsis cleaveri]|nr:ALMS1 protein [Illadopsis cleaveri]
GDLEIVTSATRKHTRDVGVTFPTPRSSQQLQQPPGQGQGGTAWQQHRARPDTRTRRDRLHLLQGQHPQRGWGHPALPWTDRQRDRLHPLQGTPWLVPAEDLKCESRKENQSSATPGPGPAWFEPWSSRKPWREPLRDKNWEEQPRLGQGAA